MVQQQSIEEEKIPKRWYTRPCRTECKTGTEKPGWPVWTGWPGWLCLMMGGGVLIKICSKAVRSHLHFWWWWWWWWRWQWWRTFSQIDAQKPIYGKKYLWEFGCTPSSSSSSSSPSDISCNKKWDTIWDDYWLIVGVLLVPFFPPEVVEALLDNCDNLIEVVVGWVVAPQLYSKV